MVGTLEKTLTTEDFEGVLLSDFQTPEKIQRYFCAKVKEYMKDIRWSVKNLAKYVGVDSDYLSRVLKGEYPFPHELVMNIGTTFFGELENLLPIDSSKEVGMQMKHDLTLYAFPEPEIPQEYRTR